jgi:hypothetical protein
MNINNNDMAKLAERIAAIGIRLNAIETRLNTIDHNIAQVKEGVTLLETTARNEIVKMYKRARHLDLAIAEIQEFIWPVVDKVFPNLLKDYLLVGERFRAAGSPDHPDEAGET